MPMIQGGDVILKYGATNNETLKWTTESISGTNWFKLSDGLGLYENNDQTGAGTGL